MFGHPTITYPAAADPDQAALTAFVVLGLFFLAATALGQWSALEPHPGVWRDGSKLVVGRDFMNFWMYGKAASLPQPGLWYDLVAYHREQTSWLGADYSGQNFSYPPTVNPFAWPFAQLPYLWALALWTALGVAILAMTLRRHGFGRKLVVAMTFCRPRRSALCRVRARSSPPP